MRGKCVKCQIWEAKCSESVFNPASQGLMSISLKVHVKIFTDFGRVYIKPWGLDLSGWTLAMLLRTSIQPSLGLPSSLCWVLAFPPMGLVLAGVLGSAQVASAQLLVLLICLLELLLELWLGKHSRPDSHHDHFCTWTVLSFSFLM